MANYRIHKPRLRVEFYHQCAYCHTREPEIGGSKIFHIDHYKPKKNSLILSLVIVLFIVFILLSFVLLP